MLKQQDLPELFILWIRHRAQRYQTNDKGYWLNMVQKAKHDKKYIAQKSRTFLPIGIFYGSIKNAWIHQRPEFPPWPCVL